MKKIIALLLPFLIVLNLPLSATSVHDSSKLGSISIWIELTSGVEISGKLVQINFEEQALRLKTRRREAHFIPFQQIKTISIRRKPTEMMQHWSRGTILLGNSGASLVNAGFFSRFEQALFFTMVFGTPAGLKSGLTRFAMKQQLDPTNASDMTILSNRLNRNQHH